MAFYPAHGKLTPEVERKLGSEEEALRQVLNRAAENELYAMQFLISDDALDHEWSHIDPSDISTLAAAYAAVAELEKSILVPLRIVRVSRYGLTRRHSLGNENKVAIEPIIHSVIKYRSNASS